MKTGLFMAEFKRMLKYSRTACDVHRRPTSQAWGGVVQASDAAVLKKGITELADCLGRGEGAADWHKAMSIIDDMARNGVRPDISCYNVALAACVRADKLDQVSPPSHEPSWHIRTLRMTVPSRISDTHTYDGHAAGFPGLLQAMDLLETLGGRGLQPNCLSYNIIILGCGR